MLATSKTPYAIRSVMCMLCYLHTGIRTDLTDSVYGMFFGQPAGQFYTFATPALRDGLGALANLKYLTAVPCIRSQFVWLLHKERRAEAPITNSVDTGARDGFPQLSRSAPVLWPSWQR